MSQKHILTTTRSDIMTDLEILKHAQEYITKLSQGINPLTDEPAADGDLIRSPKIQQCLAYVAGVLESDIAAWEGSLSARSCGKGAFGITDEEKQALFSVESTVYLKDIADLVNSVAAKKGCYKFQPKLINDYLLSIGVLKEEYGRKIPTEEGKALGIIPQEKYSERIGTYYVNTFSPSVQQFILDNIDAVIAFASSDGNASEQSKAREKIRAFTNLAFPMGQSVEQFCADNSDKCIIMSAGSCIIESEAGAYSAALVFNGRAKFISRKGIKTRSANYCILQGLLDAARMLKKPTEVVLLTSTPLGFNIRNSPNKEICNEILNELSQRGCTVYIATCKGRGEELVNLINAYRVNG